MKEIWREIPGWEGFYEVSDMGSVRSMERTIYAHYGPTGEYQGRTWKSRVLKQTIDYQGYPFVKLHRSSTNEHHRIAVHALVARTFIGPRPEGMQVRHLNGNSSDPRVENLAYGTHTENNMDTIRHGTNPYSNKTHCIQGHPFAGENLYVWSKGHKVWRGCRKCRSLATKRSRARRAGGELAKTGEYFRNQAGGRAV